MAQKIITPPIEICAICGEPASAFDWDYNLKYKVFCKNNHSATGRCNTRHRAVMLWNNAQKAKKTND